MLSGFLQRTFHTLIFRNTQSFKKHLKRQSHILRTTTFHSVLLPQFEKQAEATRSTDKLSLGRNVPFYLCSSPLLTLLLFPIQSPELVLLPTLWATGRWLLLQLLCYKYPLSSFRVLHRHAPSTTYYTGNCHLPPDSTEAPPTPLPPHRLPFLSSP